jgi:hypothetical protein
VPQSLTVGHRDDLWINAGHEQLCNARPREAGPALQPRREPVFGNDLGDLIDARTIPHQCGWQSGHRSLLSIAATSTGAGNPLRSHA